MTIRQEAAEADAKGLIKFISTVPCKNCGKYERYVSSKRCASCDIKSSADYYENNTERCKANNRTWAANNKTFLVRYNAAQYQLRKEKKAIQK